MFLALYFSFINLVLAGDLKPLTQQELAFKLRQYQTISTIEASFKQTKTISKMGLHLKSEGHFKVTRPRILAWQVVKPSVISIFMDADQVKIVTEDDTQIYKLSDIPSQSVAQSLKGLLALLDLNAEELYVHYDIFGEKGEQSRFKFIPKKSEGSPFRSLTMSLDKAGFVTRVEILEVSGDSLSIDFGLPKITTKS